MISCLMPTIPERQHLAFNSLGYFLAQDYKDSELLILTTEPDDFMPFKTKRIRIIRCCNSDLQSKIKTGLDFANGDIIARWDDDDIQAPDRLTKQLDMLGDKPGVGINHGLFFDYRTQKYFYNPPMSGNLWDSSLMFRKECYGETTRDIKNFHLIDDISYIIFGLDENSHLNEVSKERFKLWPFHQIKA